MKKYTLSKNHRKLYNVHAKIQLGNLCLAEACKLCYLCEFHVYWVFEAGSGQRRRCWSDGSPGGGHTCRSGAGAALSAPPTWQHMSTHVINWPDYTCQQLTWQHMSTHVSNWPDYTCHHLSATDLTTHDNTCQPPTWLHMSPHVSTTNLTTHVSTTDLTLHVSTTNLTIHVTTTNLTIHDRTTDLTTHVITCS